MKYLLKNIVGLWSLVTVSLLFSGCEQDPQLKEYVYPMPEVSEMYPSAGYVASAVVITGTNFGDRTEPVKVYFGEVLATEVLMCKNNRIAVKVPENAMSGDVTLKIWTNDAGVIGQYTVMPTPSVISVRSNNEVNSGIAATGDIVTIKGINFGTDANDISVSFNGTPAEFTLVDTETIEAVTPDGYLSGIVTVTIHGYSMEGGALLNPAQKGDVTAVYLKNYKNFKEVDPAVNFKNEWFTPLDWNVNEANFNNDNGSKVGGMQKNQGMLFLAFQRGWGKTATSNAKIWQEVTLPAGKYRLEVEYDKTLLKDAATDRAYIFIGRGEGENAIPDTDAINTIDGVYKEYTNRNIGDDKGTLKTEAIELTETAKVVIGIMSSIASNDTYFKVTEVRLILE